MRISFTTRFCAPVSSKGQYLMEKLIEIAADITKNPAIALGSYGLACDSEDQLVQKHLLKCQTFPCVNQSLLAGGLVDAIGWPACGQASLSSLPRLGGSQSVSDSDPRRVCTRLAMPLLWSPMRESFSELG